MQNIHSFLPVSGYSRTFKAGAVLCAYGLAATLAAAGTRWIPGEDIVAYATSVDTEAASDAILPVVYEKAEISFVSDAPDSFGSNAAFAPLLDTDSNDTYDAEDAYGFTDISGFQESEGIAEETEQVAQIPLEENVMTIAEESTAAMQEELAMEIAVKEKKKREAKEEARRQAELDAKRIHLSETETAILRRIVEAEATGEDIHGKMLVANVVLNRVNSKTFPNSVEEVVFARGQFSPIKDGRYYSVEISDTTIQAVEKALSGEDASQGALYFMSRQGADKDNAAWFDGNLYWLFNYGCHDFYK